MKILIVLDYFQPQLGYSESFFSKEFARQGHEVMVLTSDRYFPFPDYQKTVQNVLGERFLSPGEFVFDKVRVMRQKIIFELFTRAIFKGHEETTRNFLPDVVIVNKVASYNLIRMAQLKKRYKYRLVCYDSHLPSEFFREKVLEKRIVYFLFRLFCASLINTKVDKFIAVQEKTKEIMSQFYGVTRRIETIPLGTDTAKFRFDQKKGSQVRDKYRIGKKDFVVLYTGKVIAAKGVEILFDAFNELCKKYGDIKLVVVGDGAKDYVESCKTRLGSNYRNRVIWVSFQPIDELYKYYSMADVAVWPLQDSTSMNDAASCGLVFIANDNLGDKTRVSRKNALLYKQGDSLDLAKKIEYLYKHPLERKQMGIRGRILVEEKLSWDKISKEYIS